jgi:methyl-accepting chemotaxis protein
MSLAREVDALKNEEKDSAKTVKVLWNSLNMRLMLSFCVFMILVTGIFTVVPYLYFKRTLVDGMENRGEVLAKKMRVVTGMHLTWHDNDSIRNYVAELPTEQKELSFAAVLDGAGRIIGHTDHAMEGKLLEATDVTPAPGKEYTVRRVARFKNEKVMEIASPVIVDGKRLGSVLLGVSYKEVDPVLQKALAGLLITGLLILGVAGASTRPFTMRVTSGLTQLAETTREIARGELRTKVPERGYEEIRALGNDFNTMAESLGTIIRQIQETGKKAGDFSSNVLAVLQDQATSAAQQAASVSEVTATMEELSRTSRQIADNAESVKESAAQTVEMAQQGTVIIREGVGAMEQIKERVGDIAQRNLFLGEKSQEIGKVMDIIKEIASEIHLLALNATIESAAAGEHGRRFSVVASEVRRLAEKTRESTETIRPIISEIQSATSSSIQATEQGTREVDRWRETVNLSAATFQEIIQMIEKTLEASTQISLATHQQTSANEQVVQAMHQIAETVRETAANMRSSTASASELKEMVARLRETATVFRV